MACTEYGRACGKFQAVSERVIVPKFGRRAVMSERSLPLVKTRKRVDAIRVDPYSSRRRPHGQRAARAGDEPWRRHCNCACQSASVIPAVRLYAALRTRACPPAAFDLTPSYPPSAPDVKEAQ